MIASVRYTSPGTAVAITMRDGTVWHTDASRPADTDIRRALAEWLDAGNEPQPFVPPSPPPGPRYVPKILVVERLGAAGKLHAARAALLLDAPADTLTAPQLLLRERWLAATSIPAADQDVRDVLTLIGADPDVILAP